MSDENILFITGAAGFLGARLVEHYRTDPAPFDRIVATDIQSFPAAVEDCDHIDTHQLDIRDGSTIQELFETYRPKTVVHLAAIVTPPPGDHRQLQFEVDVVGTRNVIDACVASGTDQFIYTSSGAAYGYHPDNPALLVEDDSVRGNEVFAYAHHKRIVEEELAEAREKHPELRQLIFRVSTILGPTTDNQITALFEQDLVTGIAGFDAPFCIIADDDVVGAILHGIKTGRAGIFNLTGDGVLYLSEIARRMGGKYMPIPEAVMRTALTAMSTLGIGPYGPEEILFLKHRPVMDNRRLKEEFEYVPKYSTEAAFERYHRAKSQKQDSPGVDAQSPVVLITGAGGGLGQNLAIEHAERGGRIVLVDLDEEALERVYMMLRARGCQAISVVADVTDDADCQRAVDEAADAFGGIDILYNNAGIPLRGLFGDTGIDAVERVLDVNLMGSVRMTHAALDHLRESCGRIGVVSSVAGFAPLTGRSAYAASKHGLHGFFESLRSEVAADGISVSMVCPSYLSTAFRRGAKDGASEIDVCEAAQIIADGVLARRRLVLVGTTARLARWVSRLAPSVFERLMRRSVRDEFPT